MVHSVLKKCCLFKSSPRFFFVCVSVKSLNGAILTSLYRLSLDSGLPFSSLCPFPSVSDCHTYLVASCEGRSECCFPLCRWSLLHFCLQLCLDSSVVFVFLACLSMLRPAACFCSHSYTSASSSEEPAGRNIRAAGRYYWSNCSMHPISLMVKSPISDCFRIRNPRGQFLSFLVSVGGWVTWKQLFEEEVPVSVGVRTHSRSLAASQVGQAACVWVCIHEDACASLRVPFVFQPATRNDAHGNEIFSWNTNRQGQYLDGVSKCPSE